MRLPKPARLLKKYLDKYKAIPDWDTLRTARTDVILRMILPHVKGDILEIGAHEGTTTKVFAATGKEYDRQVHVIDPWDGRQQGSNTTFQIFKKNTSELDNITVHRIGSEDSSVEQKFIEDGVKFSFILIDGLHSYNAVKNDLDRYKHLLVPHGIICVDDWRGPYAFSVDIQLAAKDNLDKNYVEIKTPDSFIEAYFVKLS